MRFVESATQRLELSDGNWIDIKKELNVGEARRMQSKVFRSVSNIPGLTTEEEAVDPALDLDWAGMSVARVVAYLVRWSAVDKDGVSIPVSRSAIEALDEDSFKEIDDAIQAHREKMEEEKKVQPTKSEPQAISTS